ncbi:MAG: hypothetical protein KAG94_03840 [Clostridiales bacterium]|nr:hypothetical protein [Clostridiales bacterium]
MKKNGYITVEALLVFPVVLLLIVAFVFVILKLTEKDFAKKEIPYIEEIYQVDSLIRKTLLFEDVF